MNAFDIVLSAFGTSVVIMLASVGVIAAIIIGVYLLAWAGIYISNRRKRGGMSADR
jgi:hypothetical protein